MLWADKSPAAPVPLHLPLPRHKGKEAAHGGEEIKYFMMTCCLGGGKKARDGWRWARRGRRVVLMGRRAGTMAATRSFVLCEVVNGLAGLPGPALFVSVLIGLFHKRSAPPSLANDNDII